MGGFREFLFRGNLIQLSVAIVIGAAFGNLVTAFTKGFITPLLGIFGAQAKFENLYFTINNSQFTYGIFIDSAIAFLITAVILYYLVVWPSEWVLSKLITAEEAKVRECPECTSSISKIAKKCPFCTSIVEPITEILDDQEETKV